MNVGKIINTLVAIMITTIVMACLYYTYKAREVIRQYEEMEVAIDTTKQIPPAPRG